MRTQRPFALMLLVTALLLFALTGVALAQTTERLYLPIVLKPGTPGGTIPPRSLSLESASGASPAAEGSSIIEITPTTGITLTTE